MTITRRMNWLAVVLGAVICAPAVTQGQTFGCVPANNVESTMLQSYLVRLVTAPSGSALDTVRTRYQLPAGSASSVVHQKTKSFCAQVAQAYHNVVLPGDPQISRSMVVFKVGANRYVALDPAQMFGEFKFHVVFDASLVKLETFTG